MHFECYNHFKELPSSADLLFKLGESNSMFTTREWFETLFATTTDESQHLLLACVLDNNNVVALLPLIKINGYWQSLRHRYSSFYDLLLAKDNKDNIISCLADGLDKKNIGSLDLSPIAQNDSNLLSLQKALQNLGYEYHKHFLFYNWFHRIQQQTYEQYFKQRPSNLRNTIKRKQRKLEREHDYSMQIYKGNEVAKGLSYYHSAYSASWKATEQYAELLNAVANNLSVPDWTRIAILTIDGKAAAAQLWFVVGGKANIFRLAYNEDWKQYSVGSILTAFLMQHVIDVDKVDEIDFLTGNEKYKQDWMSERRERWSMMLVKQKSKNNNFGILSALTKLFNRH